MKINPELPNEEAELSALFDATSFPKDTTGLPALTPLFGMGLLLIALSGALFGLPELTVLKISPDTYFGFFVAHYLLAIGYSMALLFSKSFKIRRGNFDSNVRYLFLALVLDLISAYALNRNLPIFNQSVSWLSMYLISSCMGLVGFGLRAYIPRWMQVGVYFLLGMAWVLFFYLAVYLFPIYPIGMVAFFVLGISLHAFIPLLLVFFLTRTFFRECMRRNTLMYASLAGALVPILVGIALLIRWNGLQNDMADSYNNGVAEDSVLPAWVPVSQLVSRDWMTERMLKSDLVYDTPRQHIDFFDFPSRSFDEARKHDPLVFVATALFGKLALSEEERVKLLEVMYESRHKSQVRYWSGDYLQTAYVVSQVRLWPQYRMAYTEKIASIRNLYPKGRWNLQQEAIYTMKLPEGATVTSLSLWINGVEEKGYLTSKSKADTAYQTIVGREMRDPSVVHWQEGNTVSVRIFPCTPSEDRRFKIGITSPLALKDGELVYENIQFDGPTSESGRESVRVQLEDATTEADAPFAFSNPKKGLFTYEGAYTSSWEIKVKAPELSTNAFSFDGKSYQVVPYVKQYAGFDPQAIYLDINSSWTADETDQVWAAVQPHKVYVYLNGLTQVDEENHEELFEQLRELKFSLFPIYAIKHPGAGLLIAKSTTYSPNLKDLKESQFKDLLVEHLQTHSEKLNLFELGNQTSPYLKILKELRVFNYDSGSPAELATLLSKQQFIRYPEDEKSVLIEQAGMKIVETTAQAATKAPDHLLRLFAYNDVMRKLNRHYFEPDHFNPGIIAEAAQAYVVSPVSSLIVLETQQDYERFDIKKAENSLQNASSKSSGAVPEPHEWLLIGLTLILVAYLLLKP